MLPTCIPNNFTFRLEDTPSEKGTYLLWLILEQKVAITVGKLGEAVFEAGTYFYAGSALGSGGLRGRLRHHLSNHSKPHWHIDYILPFMHVQGWVVEVGFERKECLWSQALIKVAGAFCPLAGFGASDCWQGCISHLVGFK